MLKNNVAANIGETKDFSRKSQNTPLILINIMEIWGSLFQSENTIHNQAIKLINVYNQKTSKKQQPKNPQNCTAKLQIFLAIIRLILHISKNMFSKVS